MQTAWKDIPSYQPTDIMRLCVLSGLPGAEQNTLYYYYINISIIISHFTTSHICAFGQISLPSTWHDIILNTFELFLEICPGKCLYLIFLN